MALAIAPLFAGPHAVAVVSDGTHVDIVFGHEHLHPHNHDHAVSHSHAASHHHHSTTHAASHHHEHKQTALVKHPESHPDHVFHLSASKSEPTLTSVILPVYEGIDGHIQVLQTTPLIQTFLVNTQPIQLFANPPPWPMQGLQFLRTIVLMI